MHLSESVLKSSIFTFFSAFFFLEKEKKKKGIRDFATRLKCIAELSNDHTSQSTWKPKLQ